MCKCCGYYVSKQKQEDEIKENELDNISDTNNTTNILNKKSSKYYRYINKDVNILNIDESNIDDSTNICSINEKDFSSDSESKNNIGIKINSYTFNAKVRK